MAEKATKEEASDSAHGESVGKKASQGNMVFNKKGSKGNVDKKSEGILEILMGIGFFIMIDGPESGPVTEQL